MEGRAGCFAFIVLRMSCYCKCSVILPHTAVGWSDVCDCVCVLIILTYFFVVSYKRQYVQNVLVNRLVKFAQEKGVVRWT